MGNQQQNPKHKPKRLSKIQVEVACVKVKAHLELVKDRKSNEVMKAQKQLVNLINGSVRNKTEELLLAEKIVNDLKYIQACSTLMAYANTLKNYAGMIAQSEGQAAKLQELIIYVFSIIYAAQFLGLSSLNEFKTLMMNFFGCEMITVKIQQVDPKIVESFKVKPTPFEINTYFLEMGTRNSISLEKINEIHQFTTNPMLPADPNHNNPYANNPNTNNPYANNPYNAGQNQNPNQGNNPYANNPYANNPYNNAGQNQGNNPYANNPYGNNPYNTDAFGNNPYANNPSGNNPYGNNPHGNNPYGNNPYANNPYNNTGNPYQNNPANNTNQNPYQNNPGAVDPFHQSKINPYGGANNASKTVNGPGFNPNQMGPSNIPPSPIVPVVPAAIAAQKLPPPNFANFDNVKLNDINSIDDIPQYPDMDMDMNFPKFQQPQQPPQSPAMIPPVFPEANQILPPQAPKFTAPEFQIPVVPPPVVAPLGVPQQPPVSMASHNPYPAMNTDATNPFPAAKNTSPAALDNQALFYSDLNLDTMNFEPEPVPNVNNPDFNNPNFGPGPMMDQNFDLICEQIRKGL